jgi:hypothetical protein
MPENQTFSLLTNTDNYWNTDIKSIQKELQELTYSATPFQFDQQIAKINAHKSAFNKDIIVITDAVGVTQKQTANFKKEDVVYYNIPEAEQKNNTAIDSVFIQQSLDNFYEIGVQVSTNEPSDTEVPIALYNANKLIAKTIIQLDTKAKTIHFTIPKEDFHGYVSLSDQGLSYDNTYYFSLSKPSKTNVISIGDDAKSSFLSKIYTADEFNYTNFPLASLDYNQLEKQDAIIINELAVIPQALQTTLKDFANKGGNVILIPAVDSPIAAYNTFLSTLGAIEFKSVTSAKKITKINFNHPLYSTVFEKKIDNFQYPSTTTGFDIKASTSAALTYEDQSPFLVSLDNSVSAVYVFAAPLNKTNSSFQNSPLIVPTFYNMAQNRQKTGINAITIGDTQPFIVEAKLYKDEILTVKNQDERFIPMQQVLNTKVKLSFNENPTTSGNFSIVNGNNTIEHLSFNYNRSESNLELANPDIAANYKSTNDLESVFNRIVFDRTDTQIWKWFLILTLLFVILELLIQKFVK